MQKWFGDEIRRLGGLMRLCGDNIKKKLGFDVTLTKAGCESHILGYGV